MHRNHSTQIERFDEEVPNKAPDAGTAVSTMPAGGKSGPEQMTYRANAGRRVGPTHSEYLEIMEQFSHDIRNPLCVIKDCASLLHDEILGGLNDQQCLVAGALWERADDIHILADALLNFARLANKTLDDRREVCPVDKLLKECHARCRERAVFAPSCFHFHIRRPVPNVLCNPFMARQVILNLWWHMVKAAGPDRIVRLDIVELSARRQVSFRLTSPEYNVSKTRATGLLTQLRNGRNLSAPRLLDLSLGIACDLAEFSGGTIRSINKPSQPSGFEYRLPDAGDFAWKNLEDSTP